MWEGIPSGDSEDKVTVKENCEAKHNLQAALTQVAQQVSRGQPRAHFKQAFSPFCHNEKTKSRSLLQSRWITTHRGTEPDDLFTIFKFSFDFLIFSAATRLEKKMPETY